MCDRLVELAEHVSREELGGKVIVQVVSPGTPLETKLRNRFLLNVKGFVLAETVHGRIVRFKHLKEIWKYFRDSEKERAYLKQTFLNFIRGHE